MGRSAEGEVGSEADHRWSVPFLLVRTDTILSNRSLADVIGHTPNFERIFHRCNSEIIIIDTGISRAYGGVLSALEIDYKLYNRPASKGFGMEEHERSGEEEDQEVLEVASGTMKEFVEVETVHAIYPRGRVRLDRRESVVKLDTSKPAVEHDP